MNSQKELFTNYFNKIQLLNYIAGQIVNYGLECGMKDLADYVDLNCGAIPAGDYNHVIDESAPQQFLKLYSQIAQSRFAFAVTQVSKIHPDCIKVMADFCTTVGKNLELEQLTTAEEAFQAFNYFILEDDLTSENKTINQKEPEKLEWQLNEDKFSQYWEKAGGNVENYITLLKAFVKGMFHTSGFVLDYHSPLTFSISKA